MVGSGRRRLSLLSAALIACTMFAASAHALAAAPQATASAAGDGRTGVVKDVDEFENRWILPLQSGVVLTGLRLGPGGRVLPAPPPGRRHMEFYGDSITEGVEALCGQTGADGTADYAHLAGEAFHAGFNQVGFGEQGIIQPGHGNVGTASHPNVQGHRKAAARLIPVIESVTGWKAT